MWEALWQWLWLPIDASRAHGLEQNVAWHGRLMVATWGFLFPISIIITRFLKVTPRQQWPNELDNRFWFRVHVAAQVSGGVLTAFAVWLVWSPGSEGNLPWLHRLCGWSVVSLYCAQFIGGIARGTRGGMDEPAPDGSIHGDHFDMTTRRVIFEYAHKTLGYTSIVLAAMAMLLGLWITNAYIWMWLGLFGWWCFSITVYAALQRKGMALDTYQAIWGPDPNLPGNQRKPIGFGIQRRNG
ncbi:cytochrome b561 domain-containing protein [Pseudahrensia aquimaris]|uniref:Cytochrome b561 domain-containing protein n=1 Tax=Pseudahrensia aquimaris TaxID=744461 RepID=A0ABW3FBL4_9HYPH